MAHIVEMLPEIIIEIIHILHLLHECGIIEAAVEMLHKGAH